MNKIHLSLLLATTQFISFSVIADSKDPVTVVVSASHLAVPKDKLGNSVTIIDSEEIAQRKESSIIELLRGVPGVDVVQSGGPGGNAAVFLRGANSEHTLVLIDGIEANSPISPTRAFNFSGLTTDNVERIEIVRGPQSMVYGSDAMGGVINIITKKGDGPPVATALLEAGSHQSFTEQAGVSGSENSFNYSLQASHLFSGGVSAASRKYGNKEDDSFEQSGVSARVGGDLSDRLKGDVIFRMNRAESDLDQFGGAGGDDPNRVFDNREMFARAQAVADISKDYFSPAMGISYTKQRYTDLDSVDEFHPVDTLDSQYRGSLVKFDVKNPIHFNDTLQFLVGAETEQEQGDSFLISNSAFGPFESDFAGRSLRTNGFYSEAEINLNPATVTGGIRVDDHDKFGSEVTWKVAPSVDLDPVRVFGSYATGFKAPSLYQLYSEFGRLDLDPETSKGFDAGVETALFDTGVTARATYYHNSFDDLITFDPGTFLFENIAHAKTHGGEFSLEGNPSSSTLVRVTYTLLKTEDESTGDALLRRAKNKVGVHGTWKVNDKVNCGVDVEYVGPRDDNDFSTFPATRTSLHGYTLVGGNVSYTLSRTVELFARIENALDQNYEEVFGYGTLGVTAFGGIKVTFE